MSFSEYLQTLTGVDADDSRLENWVKEAQDGLILEFGVASGYSLRRIAAATERQVYGFDSFKGLPDDAADGWSPGTFACAVPTFEQPNVSLVIGWAQDTLEDFLKEHSEPVAFVHIDTDIYSAAVYILNTLYDHGRLVSGSVILFDELLNYGSYEHHEYKAFIEFVEKTGIEVEFVGRRNNEAYAFKVK
jgi:predicted O-methyltransferase YrrM